MKANELRLGNHVAKDWDNLTWYQIDIEILKDLLESEQEDLESDII